MHAIDALEDMSDAYCFGLAELPAADMFLQLRHGNCAPIFSYRVDLWKHAQGPGKVALGANCYLGLGDNYREAIRSYYRTFVRARYVQASSNSPIKEVVATAPGFDTWGVEAAAERTESLFDQQLLESAYDDLKKSGMSRGVFMIEQKWEGSYGLLEHDPNRFPDFEKFLGRLRNNGYRLGMWAAFIRCDDPAALGLNMSHMLHGTGGLLITKTERNRHYYLLDFTQPQVEQVLSDRIRQLMRHYQPALVKFDFGYELPALSSGAPLDMNWAGERLLWKGTQIVVTALRSINPDVAVMYYCLSPLFSDYFDIHSIDDLYQCSDDYASEANRRFFFSSLSGEIGITTYSSSGYDWVSAPSIWFDAITSGSLCSLNAFKGDERNSKPTPYRIAKFNGLSAIGRHSNRFTVEALDSVTYGSMSGAHTRSWMRLEEGSPVLVALRAVDSFSKSVLDGRITSTCSIVLASRDSRSLIKTGALGVVPFGNGEVAIRHEGSAATARVITHSLGGGSHEEIISLRAGILQLHLSEQLAGGAPVEWVEVNLL